jgi:GTP pyrophosphokinase
LVDGHWVSLKRALHTGERVEVLTVDGVGPSFEWLNPDLGYTQSPLARGKIRRWFRRRSDQVKIALGREQLTRVARRLSLDVPDFEALAKRFSYTDQEILFRDIGGCDVALERVIPELLEAYGEGQLPHICTKDEEASHIPVVGAGSLDIGLATCCRPQPDDDIVGHIPDLDHTVQVHRSDCSAFLVKFAEDRHRFVEVKWGRACETYLACMEILSQDRPFYLRDVWEIISDLGLNVADVDVKVNRAKDARILVCVDVENWLQFNCVLSQIEDLPGTIWVHRKVLSVGSVEEEA